MKPKNFLLSVVFAIISSFTFGQGLTVSGFISCTDGLPVDWEGGPYIILYETGNGLIADSVYVPVDPSGTFNITIDPNFPQGSIYLYYYDTNGTPQSASANYSPENMNLVFTLDGCADPVECSASFYMYTDSLNPGTVNVVSTSVGPDLTYTWSFGDGSSSTDFSTTHFYSEMGTYTLCLTISASDGCTDEFCDTFTMYGDSTFENGPGMMLQGFTMLVNMVAGVKEIGADNIQLFPNPVSADANLSIILENSFAGQLSILDVNGRLVNATRFNGVKGTNQIPVNMQELHSGIYQVVLKSDNGKVMTKRFTRQ